MWRTKSEIDHERAGRVVDVREMSLALHAARFRPAVPTGLRLFAMYSGCIPVLLTAFVLMKRGPLRLAPRDPRKRAARYVRRLFSRLTFQTNLQTNI